MSKVKPSEVVVQLVGPERKMFSPQGGNKTFVYVNDSVILDANGKPFQCNLYGEAQTLNVPHLINGCKVKVWPLGENPKYGQNNKLQIKVAEVIDPSKPKSNYSNKKKGGGNYSGGGNISLGNLDGASTSHYYKCLEMATFMEKQAWERQFPDGAAGTYNQEEILKRSTFVFKLAHQMYAMPVPSNNVPKRSNTTAAPQQQQQSPPSPPALGTASSSAPVANVPALAPNTQQPVAATPVVQQQQTTTEFVAPANPVGMTFDTNAVNDLPFE